MSVASSVTSPLIAAPGPGVYRNIPMDEYHRWDAMSNSRMNALRRSPAHLCAYLDGIHIDTKATRIGRASHTTILEPELFDATFVTAEQCTAETGKLAQCSYTGTALTVHGWRCGTHQKKLADTDFINDRLPLSPGELETCLRIRGTINTHPSASGLLGAREAVELSIVWVDPATGVLCKARIDCYSPGLAQGEPTAVDLKTAKDATMAGFAKAIDNHGYHRQAAHYSDGLEVLGFGIQHFNFIAVEKEPPYAVAVYRLTEGAMDAGRDQIKKALELYAACVRKDSWPAYPSIVQDIALPDYAWSRIAEEVGE